MFWQIDDCLAVAQVSSSPDVRCCLRPFDGGVDDIGIRLFGVGYTEALDVRRNETGATNIDHHERLCVFRGVVNSHCAMVWVLAYIDHCSVQIAVRPVRGYTPGQSGGRGAHSSQPRLIGMLEVDRVALGKALHGERVYWLGGADPDATAVCNSHSFADICGIPGLET